MKKLVLLSFLFIGGLAIAQVNEGAESRKDGSVELKTDATKEAYSHYNGVYQIFLKSNNQEIVLIELIGTNDLSAIKENNEVLRSLVIEGVANLNQVEAFKGDNTMIEATEALFKFYQQEVEDTQLAIEYILKLENFKQVQEKFDQIAEEKRTQENVDEFNNAVNELNFAVETYNESDEINNKTRGILISNWNNAAENFKNKYIAQGDQ